ncbi:hypothetical protein [Paucilactobacillus hokkaidonensis]|uniref:hypothetical protein n=1 Tax=Paucilactobacillus hokkaidonensis TaxID=1193095 RepID=UPI0006CFBC6E|nr:hypothetical protein [Paucilactobacillus hokkaidonensis]
MNTGFAFAAAEAISVRKQPQLLVPPVLSKYPSTTVWLPQLHSHSQQTFPLAILFFGRPNCS